MLHEGSGPKRMETMNVRSELLAEYPHDYAVSSQTSQVFYSSSINACGRGVLSYRYRHVLDLVGKGVSDFLCVRHTMTDKESVCQAGHT